MVQLRLSAMGLRVPPPQIVLTHGATHALELVIRRLLRPGDRVLVEDPGYCSLFGNLQLQGITMLGVPRLADGPDLQALDRLAAEHRPKLFFVQSLMHNPTGSSLLPASAHRLLQLAAQHGFRLVEMDFYADLASPLQTRLATLDHLERVIYIGALSKTMLGPVRLGYLAGDAALATELANVKLLSSVTSAQLNERLAYQVLTDKACRRHLDLITARLQDCTAAAIRQLEAHGFVLHSEPRCGKYLWARHPAHASAETLAERARAAGLLLAPGRVFRPERGDTPWFRLNVAQTEQAAWQDWLTHGP
jgi:DNA-binding transcriptional MocR family regulator